jgi:hypothetical protein
LLASGKIPKCFEGIQTQKPFIPLQF